MTVHAVAHPSLFFDITDVAALKAKVQVQGSIAKEAYTRMLTDAAYYATKSTNPYHLEGIPGRTIALQVTTLALAGYLTNNSSHSTKAVDILCSAASQYEPADFFAIDDALTVGDAAQAYAVGYDLLYPSMNGAQRTQISNEIHTFGNWIYTNSPASPWGSSEPSRKAWNWNPVVHGALGLCAMVLGNEPDWQNLAIERIRGYFQYGFDSTGLCYEGNSYAIYGLQAAIPFSAALERQGGPDLVSENVSTKLIPQWMLHTLLPTGSGVVPVNQSSSEAHSHPLLYLTTKFQDRVGLWGWLRLVGPTGDNTYGQGWWGYAAVLPYVILWSDPSLTSLSPSDARLSQDAIFSRGQASFRNGWGDSDSLVTFISAFGWSSIHNNADELSFTFYSNNESFAIDPGIDYYETVNHNGLLIDGAGPTTGVTQPCNGTVVRTRTGETSAYIMGDALEAYQKMGSMVCAKRQLLFVKGSKPYIIMADDIQKNSSNHSYTWLLHTAAGNSLAINQSQHGATITGARTGALCNIRFLWPSNVQLSSSTTYLPTPTLAASATAVNPRFVTILMSLKAGETMPAITSSGTPDNMTVTVTYDTYHFDSVNISRTDISFAQTSTCVPITGDFNNDCKVDYQDLARFYQEWLTCR